jgi:hypothetical protein
VTYSDNQYGGTIRLCVDKNDVDLAGWKSASGEASASQWSGSFSDPDRTVGTYAGSLGLPATLEGFLDEARKQSRLTWREDLTASTVNEYIRAGFN